MRSKKIEQHKETLHLTNRQREIIRGLMLGDGHIESPYRKEVARLKIAYRAAHKEYIDWLWKEFREWVLKKPKLKEQIVERRAYKSYWFTTVSHKDFAEIWRKWYLERKKVVPKDEVYKITPLGLAIWFMDDSSIKSERHRSFYLNTQSFTIEEVRFLQGLLKEKFKIKSSIKKVKRVNVGFQIYISKENAKRFKEIIDPYVLSCMRYKLNYRVNRMPKK